MSDAEDVESGGETEVTEAQEENDAEEVSPVEDEADDETEDGEEQDGENQAVGEVGAEDEAEATENNADEEAVEAPETELQEEEVTEDVELEIRDEDEGRPVSSLSKKVSFLQYVKTTRKTLHFLLANIHSTTESLHSTHSRCSSVSLYVCQTLSLIKDFYNNCI